MYIRVKNILKLCNCFPIRGSLGSLGSLLAPYFDCDWLRPGQLSIPRRARCHCSGNFPGLSRVLRGLMDPTTVIALSVCKLKLYSWIFCMAVPKQLVGFAPLVPVCT